MEYLVHLSSELRICDSLSSCLLAALFIYLHPPTQVLLQLRLPRNTLLFLDQGGRHLHSIFSLLWIWISFSISSQSPLHCTTCTSKHSTYHASITIVWEIYHIHTNPFLKKLYLFSYHIKIFFIVFFLGNFFILFFFSFNAFTPFSSPFLMPVHVTTCPSFNSCRSLFF